MRRLSDYFILAINYMFPGKQVLRDISYGKSKDKRYDEYPVSEPNAPLVIFWYGGSWKSGEKAMYRFIGARLQAIGAHAFVVDYPKFPNRKFPGFIDDARTAIDEIKSRYPDRKIILMGHSAGANTALILGLNKEKIADKVISVSGVCTLGKKWQPVFGNALEKGLHDPRSYVKTANKETQFMLIHGRLDFIVSFTDSLTLDRKLRRNNINSTLILIYLMDHVLIIFLIFLGPLFRTRQRMKKFILE